MKLANYAQDDKILECFRVKGGGLGLAAAAVADGEVVAGVGWEEGGDEAEAVGEGCRGEEWVLALAEFGVVEVDGEGEQVDGDGVGKGGLEEVEAGFFVYFAGIGGVGREGCGTGLPGVLAGFAADFGDGLREGEGAEGLGDAGFIGEGVAYVDEELEGEGEGIAKEAGGDEDAFVGWQVGAVGEADVAVADGFVEVLGEGVGGDEGATGFGGGGLGARLGDGEGDEVEDAVGEGGDDERGDSLDDALEVVVGDLGVAEGGEADAVGRGAGDERRSDVGCLEKGAGTSFNAICHEGLFYLQWLRRRTTQRDPSRWNARR